MSDIEVLNGIADRMIERGLIRESDRDAFISTLDDELQRGARILARRVAMATVDIRGREKKLDS